MADRQGPSRRRPNDPRHPVRIPATIETAAAGPPLAAQLMNLSRGGLALRYFGVLDPGSAVRVTLTLDEQSTLTFDGRVAWVDRAFQAGDGAAGIAFRDILDPDLVRGIASAAGSPGGPPVPSSPGES